MAIGQTLIGQADRNLCHDDYRHRDLRPPPWAHHLAAWERAIAVHKGPQPNEAAVFIHRDYHPGNVLWSRGSLSGVVDWAQASRGGGGADVGHCRLNLVRAFDLATADEFLRRWQAVAGAHEYHPYWDIVAVVGWIPEQVSLPPEHERLEAFLCRAVAHL